MLGPELMDAPVVLCLGDAHLGNFGLWRDREAGWSGAPNREARPSQRFRAALLTALPPGASGLRFAARRAGAGSLGRPRWTAIATWRGDAVVREAKALVPSAWHWVLPRGPAEAPAQLAFGPYRSPDAHLAYGRDLMVRRLADSRKLEYPGDFGRRSFPRLLAAMGHELASLHAGTSGAAKRIAADLGERPKGWLLAADKLAAAQVREDYDAWRRRRRGGTGKR